MKTSHMHTILSQDVRRLLESHPLTSRLHPTHFGISKNERGICSRPNGTDTHILILCIGGHGILSVNDKKYDFSSNNLLLIPAGCPHEYGSFPGESWSIYWTHFSGTDSELYFSHIMKKIIPIPYSDSIFNKALAIFLDYHTCIYNNITTRSLIKASQLLGYLLSFLFYSDALEARTEYGKRGIEKALEMMNEKVEYSVTLQELAKYSGLSKPHFSFLFKKHTGFAPIEYFNMLKIRHACNYLESPDMNIGEISERIGIDNQHYFSRLFSKIMGVSPRDYRKLRTLYVQ